MREAQVDHDIGRRDPSEEVIVVTSAATVTRSPSPAASMHGCATSYPSIAPPDEHDMDATDPAPAPRTQQRVQLLRLVQVAGRDDEVRAPARFQRGTQLARARLGAPAWSARRLDHRVRHHEDRGAASQLLEVALAEGRCAR